METIVASTADAAIRVGLLGLLLTMPPTLFLALGLKRQGRITVLFGAGLVFFLALTVLGIVAQGFLTGEVFALSRSTLMATRADNPVFFWVSAAVFGVGSLGALVVSVLLALRTLLPSNPVFNRTRRKRRAG